MYIYTHSPFMWITMILTLLRVLWGRLILPYRESPNQWLTWSIDLTRRERLLPPPPSPSRLGINSEWWCVWQAWYRGSGLKLGLMQQSGPADSTIHSSPSRSMSQLLKINTWNYMKFTLGKVWYLWNKLGLLLSNNILISDTLSTIVHYCGYSGRNK